MKSMKIFRRDKKRNQPPIDIGKMVLASAISAILGIAATLLLLIPFVRHNEQVDRSLAKELFDLRTAILDLKASRQVE
jgi:hypothetical protein